MEKLGLEQASFTKIFKSNLKGKSNRVLNNYYQHYVLSNQEVYAYGLISPLLDYQNTTFLSDELNRILKNKKAEKYFGELTTPLRETFNKQQELDLLKVLIQIKKYKNLEKKFKVLDSQELVKYIRENNKKVWRLVDNHTQRYAWVHYVYEGPAADHIYFLDIIKDFIRREINPSKEIAEHKKSKSDIRSQQKKILKQIKANDYERNIIELARDLVFFKPYRRELQTWSYYHAEFLLKEIAKRLRLSLKQVRMMLPEEMEEALLRGKINSGVINERIKLVVYGRKGGRKLCLTGKQAQDFFHENAGKEKEIKAVKEITGAVAFKGKARGKVKLINTPEEIKKMNEKDILVSAATSPNLMPAIRKAAAIVTDEGGIMCHAAIVAREMKKPCVIGTKIATKVLKDGDLVEVYATKGVVKKIHPVK
ncbi:hypothetical protein HZB93_00300 [Candidatus Falkowbacteria bacterium]|nr:hypothetical protein [Candidatus Falkowbacteria bacterium]